MSWGSLGAVLGDLGAILGGFGAVLGRSWSLLELPGAANPNGMRVFWGFKGFVFQMFFVRMNFANPHGMRCFLGYLLGAWGPLGVPLGGLFFVFVLSFCQPPFLSQSRRHAPF